MWLRLISSLFAARYTFKSSRHRPNTRLADGGRAHSDCASIRDGGRSYTAVDINGMDDRCSDSSTHATSLKFTVTCSRFQIVTTDANTAPPNHNWVWLRLNGTDPMLNTAYEYDKRPLSPDLRRVGIHRDTALADCCALKDVPTLQSRPVCSL
jgi:hypothetical protein